MAAENFRKKVIDSSWESGCLNFVGIAPRSTQWWVLVLECGHIVGRFCSPKTNSDISKPEYVTCEYCSNNKKAILKNFDYTSDDAPYERYPDTGLPKTRN